MGGPDLEPLRHWLRWSTGLQAERLGPSRLERAVKQRWPLSGSASPEVYLERLLRDEREQQLLLEQLVVGESWFLREPRSFEQLRELSRRERQRPLRVLSCGCSGGEEPYSAVIALLEAGLTLRQLQVEAIDISAVALARAADGLYGSHSLRGLERERLERHFLPEDRGSSSAAPPSRRWRLRPEIRAAVRFHHGDLQRQLARLPGDWHAVFCRNVMLYLDDQARLDLFEAIAQRLAPQGMLLVATAEALMVPAERFRRLPGGHGAAFAPIPMPLARPDRRPHLPPGAGAFPAQGMLLGQGEALSREEADGPISPQAAHPAGTMTAREAARSGRPSLQPSDHLDLARQLQQTGAVEEAHAAARRCLYLDPGCQEALELSALLARELGRHQEAERQLRRLQRHRRRTQP